MVLFPLFFHIFSYDSPCTALTHRSFAFKSFCPWITSFFLSKIQHSISILHYFFLTILPIFSSLQFYPHYPHSYPHFNYYTVNNFHFINFIATFIPSFPIQLLFHLVSNTRQRAFSFSNKYIPINFPIIYKKIHERLPIRSCRSKTFVCQKGRGTSAEIPLRKYLSLFRLTLPNVRQRPFYTFLLMQAQQ